MSDELCCRIIDVIPQLCNSFTVQMVFYNVMTLALNILPTFLYASVNLTNYMLKFTKKGIGMQLFLPPDMDI